MPYRQILEPFDDKNVLYWLLKGCHKKKSTFNVDKYLVKEYITIFHGQSSEIFLKLFIKKTEVIYWSI